MSWLREWFSSLDPQWLVISKLVMLATLIYVICTSVRVRPGEGEVVDSERKSISNRAGAAFWLRSMQILPIVIAASVCLLWFPFERPVCLVLISRSRTPPSGTDPAIETWRVMEKGENRQWIDAGLIVDDVLSRLPKQVRWGKTPDHSLDVVRESILNSLNSSYLSEFAVRSSPSFTSSIMFESNQTPAWLVESIELTVMRLLCATHNVRRIEYVVPLRTDLGRDSLQLAHLAVPTKAYQAKAFNIERIPRTAAIEIQAITRRNGGDLTCQFKLAATTKSENRSIQFRLYCDDGIPRTTEVEFNTGTRDQVIFKMLSFTLPPGVKPLTLKQESHPAIQLAVPADNSGSAKRLRVAIWGKPEATKEWRKTLNVLSQGQHAEFSDFVSQRFMSFSRDMELLQVDISKNPYGTHDVVIDIRERKPVVVSNGQSDLSDISRIETTDISADATLVLRTHGGQQRSLIGRYGWDNLYLKRYPIAAPAPRASLGSIFATFSKIRNDVRSIPRSGKPMPLIWSQIVGPYADRNFYESTYIGFDPELQECLAPLSDEDSRAYSFWTTVARAIARTQTPLRRDLEVDAELPVLLVDSAQFASVRSAQRRWHMIPVLVLLALHGVLSYRSMVTSPRGKNEHSQN